MGESKPWVDGPYTLISPSRSGASVGKTLTPARAMAAEMSIVHNCLIRTINSVHNQCINVAMQGTDTDKVDFANYAFQWTEMVHEHHTSEDSTLFPSMGEIAGVPGLMDVNTNEHAGFHDRITLYAEYLKEVIQGKEKLHGEKVKSLIDSFMPELHTHLENEIDTLVNLEKYDKVDWDAWFKKEVGKMIKEMMGQYEYRINIFPLSIISHDKSFGDGVWKSFPPIPYIFELVLRWMYMYKNQRWWRFAGCDFKGYPKELPFA